MAKDTGGEPQYGGIRPDTVVLTRCEALGRLFLRAREFMGSHACARRGL